MSSSRLQSVLNQIQPSGTAAMDWSAVPTAPADPILGLNTKFAADTFPKKLNLGVGAYRTEEGKPLVLNAVLEAERSNLGKFNKEYLPIDGLADYNKVTRELILGKDSTAIKENRVVTAQALSGTGALRVGSEFIEKFMPGATFWMSNPTWGNHKNIFMNLTCKSYNYYDKSINGLNLDGMIKDLSGAKEGDVVLLHACAHNPTGCDPTPEQWKKIADLFVAKKLVPFFDSAYQGFASGSLDTDAASVRLFDSMKIPMLISQSYAKNFGLYGERVGAFSIAADTEANSKAALSQVKGIIRKMYSSPPIHGARIVATALTDPALRANWDKELKGMADRIIEMRYALKAALDERKTPGNWDHVVSQIGMFSFTGLNADQVKRMIDEFHIYMTGDGRISMAGVSKAIIPYLADSMDKVVRGSK